jgi:transcription elongation factor GreA
MPQSQKHIFTKEGFEKIKEDLQNLKDIVRLEIAGKLNDAKEYGDLSENAAYQTAMEQRDLNEARIAELEEMITNAQIVKVDSKNQDGIVSMGDKVELEDESGNKIDFEIVGTGETDIIAKKFNINSPLVSAVMGKKKGQSVEVTLPIGKRTYKIVKVK